MGGGAFEGQTKGSCRRNRRSYLMVGHQRFCKVMNLTQIVMEYYLDSQVVRIAYQATFVEVSM